MSAVTRTLRVTHAEDGTTRLAYTIAMAAVGQPLTVSACVRVCM